jgi:hypothetical protein
MTFGMTFVFTMNAGLWLNVTGIKSYQDLHMTFDSDTYEGCSHAFLFVKLGNL